MYKTAVLLAGGEGTRLRPVTYEMPKPLVPVQGKAILTWQVMWFAKAGVERFVVIVPPKWERAFSRWKQEIVQEIPVEIELWTEVQPMGTMGALVYHLAHRLGSDAFFVSNGDELKGLNLQAFADFHAQYGKGAVSLALVSVAQPQHYGVAEMDGEKIVRFHEKPEKPPTSLINSGLYLVDPAVFAEVEKEESFLMFEKDLFPRLAQEGRLFGCGLEGPWYDCGTLERWEKAIHEWPGVV